MRAQIRVTFAYLTELPLEVGKVLAYCLGRVGEGELSDQVSQRLSVLLGDAAAGETSNESPPPARLGTKDFWLENGSSGT
jgi:hypothetical protein